MGSSDEAARATPPVRARSVTWRALWPYIVLPPIVVAAWVAWLWFGAEGGFVEAGRYTLS
jgi:hypothetical protein